MVEKLKNMKFKVSRFDMQKRPTKTYEDCFPTMSGLTNIFDTYFSLNT